MVRSGYCCWRQFKCHLPAGSKRALVGAGVLEKCQCMRKMEGHSTRAPAPTRPPSQSSLFFCSLLCPLGLYEFLSLIRIHTQVTPCPYQAVHLVLHLMPRFTSRFHSLLTLLCPDTWLDNPVLTFLFKPDTNRPSVFSR